MTDVEVIEDAIRTIGSLNVPMEHFETLGTPLNRVRNNLIVLIRSILEAQKQRQMAEAQQESEEVHQEIPSGEEPIEATEE